MLLYYNHFLFPDLYWQEHSSITWNSDSNLGLVKFKRLCYLRCRGSSTQFVLSLVSISIFICHCLSKTVTKDIIKWRICLLFYLFYLYSGCSFNTKYWSPKRSRYIQYTIYKQMTLAVHTKSMYYNLCKDIIKIYY